jgi:hypothetical protein
MLTLRSTRRRAATALTFRTVRRVLLLGAVSTAAVLFCSAPVEATIGEQRARLPPPAFCEDPVEGVWRSHKYNEQFGDWTIFTLEIHRVPGTQNALRGTISNELWDGGPSDEQPGPCDGRRHWIVSMDAQGSIQGNRIFFGAVGQWRLDRALCVGGPWGYNLDNFSGDIDPEIQEFQSVNNDGGRAVDDPHVFRRVRCFSPDSLPHVEVAPPPFFPRRAGGC